MTKSHINKCFPDLINFLHTHLQTMWIDISNNYNDLVCFFAISMKWAIFKTKIIQTVEYCMVSSFKKKLLHPLQSRNEKNTKNSTYNTLSISTLILHSNLNLEHFCLVFLSYRCSYICISLRLDCRETEEVDYSLEYKHTSEEQPSDNKEMTLLYKGQFKIPDLLM